MKKAIMILIILAIVPLTNSALAARSINLPFAEDFDQNNYADLLWVSGGGTHEWQPNGGWQGGAAKFTPPTSAQDYTGLGTFSGLNTQVLHVRFLLKLGPTFETTSRADGYGTEDKFVIAWRQDQSPSYRAMAMFNRTQVPGEHWYSWGACQNAVCEYDCTYTSWKALPCPETRFRSTDYSDQWVAIEYAANITNGTSTVYIWTQDGQFSGEYKTVSIPSGSAWSMVQIIGGYFNGYHVRDDNNYFIIDELKFDNKLIGPPQGFVGGASNDPPPEDPPPEDPPPAADNTHLPFYSDFEEGNWSEWMGGISSNMSIISTDPNSGNYCARAPLTQGTHSDNYLDYYFGDHVLIQGNKVDEVYLRVYSKFDAGYVWPNADQKVFLLNITDGQSTQRRYQVGIMIDDQGQYYVEHTDIADWRFYALIQNQGNPVGVRFGEWDKIKLYAKLNTPGNSDGILTLWVNDVLKAHYTNVNIRENTNYSMNKLILSSYATDASGSDGFQYYDDWALALQDPDEDNNVVVAPSQPKNLRIQ